MFMDNVSSGCHLAEVMFKLETYSNTSMNINIEINIVSKLKGYDGLYLFYVLNKNILL